jgi:hypothetical protein
VEAEALYDGITRFNRVNMKAPKDRVRKRKPLPLGRTRKQAYIAERKEGLRDYDCVTQR